MCANVSIIIIICCIVLFSNSVFIIGSYTFIAVICYLFFIYDNPRFIKNLILRFSVGIETSVNELLSPFLYTIYFPCSTLSSKSELLTWFLHELIQMLNATNNKLLNNPIIFIFNYLWILSN